MRKRSLPRHGRSADPLLLSDMTPLRLRGIPLPLVCIALGVAVLYFGDRSVAAFFPSGNESSGFGEISAAAEMAQSWWQGGRVAAASEVANKEAVPLPSSSKTLASTRAPESTTTTTTVS